MATAETVLSESEQAEIERRMHDSFRGFCEGLVAAGISLGFKEEEARLIVRQVVAGSAKMLEVSGHTPAELIRMVSSPGGTTEAGLAVLRQDDALLRLIMDDLRDKPLATHGETR